MEKENLNLNDLKNLLLVVDYAADNGAFKGWANIRKVLELRDKLENFIKNVENSKSNVENNKQEIQPQNIRDQEKRRKK